ncbi:hypothetical protein JRQ81_014070, partial [Phrynocephalus forsythii]
MSDDSPLTVDSMDYIVYSQGRAVTSREEEGTTGAVPGQTERCARLVAGQEPAREPPGLAGLVLRKARRLGGTLAARRGPQGWPRRQEGQGHAAHGDEGRGEGLGGPGRGPTEGAQPLGSGQRGAAAAAAAACSGSGRGPSARPQAPPPPPALSLTDSSSEVSDCSASEEARGLSLLELGGLSGGGGGGGSDTESPPSSSAPAQPASASADGVSPLPEDPSTAASLASSRLPLSTSLAFSDLTEEMLDAG